MNTKEYAWKDIKIMAGGVIIKATEITYNPSQEKEYLYASGSKPNSIQAGNEAYEGSLSILQSSLDKLKTVYGVQHAYQIPGIVIVVAYGPTSDGRGIQVDRLIGAEFTESEKSMSQNDMSMEVSLPFMALDLNENIDV